MKVTVYESAAGFSHNFTSPGMVLTGPLLLSGSVSNPSEAVHKQYVDTAITNINGDSFQSGSLPPGRLPALTGDISAAAGSNVVALTNTTVVPGEYTKFTVDNKGRVTFGSSLVAADIPNLSWSKITTGKPTTLAGYGITDALTAGGTVTGYLTLAGAPVSPNDIATKTYVDNALSFVSGGVVTGDIVNRFTTTTPSGYLRCNGGAVSKTTYAALYAIIGDTHTLYSTPGNGKPWQYQYQFNTEVFTEITDWKLNNSCPAQFLAPSLATVVNSTILYVFSTNYVFRATVNPTTKTVSDWYVYSTTILPPATYSAIVRANTYVYFLGGSSSQTVKYTIIDSNGDLGAITTLSSYPIPNVYRNAFAFASFGSSGGYIYLVGGTIGSDSSLGPTVHRAPISASGAVTSGWVTDGTVSYPINIGYTKAIVHNNYVYVVGGYGSNAAQSAVYYSALDATGTGLLTGGWIAATALPQALWWTDFSVVNGKLYVYGGFTQSNVAVNTIYSATINGNGSLGTWTTLPETLPFAAGGSCSYVLDNIIHVMGGQSYTPTRYYSDITKLTINTTSNSIDSITTSETTDGTFFDTITDLNRSSVVVTKNYVYLFGGPITGGTSNTVYVAAINSDGSLGTWTSAGTFTYSLDKTSAVVIKNKLYLIGGYYNGGASATVVQWAPINTDGTLGSWTAQFSLPTNFLDHKVVVLRDRVYAFMSGSTYYATIDTNGVLGTWTSTAQTTTSGYGMAYDSIFIVRNRVYHLENYWNGTVSKYVFRFNYATINNDGSISTFTQGGTSYTSSAVGAKVFVTRNKVYIFGYSVYGSNYTSSYTAYMFPINADGTLGAMEGSVVRYPYVLNHANWAENIVFAVKNKIYASNASGNNFVVGTIGGGLSDYSLYYGTTYTSTDTSVNFRLPDYSANEKTGFNFYIKT